MSEENKLQNKLTLSPVTLTLYMLGGMFPAGFVLVITGYYFMFFMTDILLLPTALAATVYSAIQWWKLLSMVASGMIIDGIPLKSGRYRGWSLIAGIVQAIAFPLAFADLGLPPVAAAIGVFVFEAILMLAYNVAWTALRTLPAKMAKTSQDINWLNVMSNVGGSLPALIWGTLSGALLSIPLWANTSNQYFGVCCIFSIFFIMAGIIMFKMAAPYDTPADALKSKKDSGAAQKQQGAGLKAIFKSLRGPMITYFISGVLNSAQAGFFQTLLTYYTAYVLGNPALAASIVTLQSVIGLIGSFVVPTMTKRVTKKGSMVFAQTFNAVSYILLAIFGTNAAVFVGLRCLMTAVGCIPNVTSYGIPLDIGDYFEMKGETSQRAILTSVGGTTVRLGFAASTTISAFALAAIGYQAGAPFTAEMGTKLTLLIAVGPAIFAAISAILMQFFYKVDERAIDAYRLERAAKAAKAENQ